MDAQDCSPTESVLASTSAATQVANVKIIFVLGAPGAGKGTLCKLLAPKIDALHFSIGDHLRSLCQDPTLSQDPAALGGLRIEELREIMVNRSLVSAEPIVAIVKHKLKAELAQGRKAFLIDGFPRSLESAKVFEAEFGYPDRVIYLECPKTITEKRFLDRKRSDDDGGIYAKRHVRFEANNPAIVQRYGDVLKTIDTSGETEVARKTLFEAFGVAAGD